MNLINTPLYAESWNVAFRRKPEGTILHDRTEPFSIIPNCIYGWAADPFVFEYEGRTYIFAELYHYVLRRGVIGVIEYRNNKGFGRWKTVLKESFHMSYPFVFRIGDEIFMIPETHSDNAVWLYRAKKFPDQWERYKVLRENVRWVDTTIIPDGDGFLGYSQSVAKNDLKDIIIRLNGNLEIISENLCPRQDPLRQRPGGRMFRKDEKLLRVTQDCTENYGKALFFCYVDEQANQIRLAPDDLHFSNSMRIDGMHTYSATDTMEVIDIKTRRLNLLNLFFRFIDKVIRILAG